MVFYFFNLDMTENSRKKTKSGKKMIQPQKKHPAQNILYNTSLTINPNTDLNSRGTFDLMKLTAALAMCAASLLRPASMWHSISALFNTYSLSKLYQTRER